MALNLKKQNKIALISLSSFAVLCLISGFSSIGVLVNKQLTEKASITKLNTTLNSAIDNGQIVGGGSNNNYMKLTTSNPSTASKLLPNDFSTSNGTNTLNFDNLNPQRIAYDTEKDSYAIITSSDDSSRNTITKYNTNQKTITYMDSGTSKSETVSAGSVDWTVSLEDLKKTSTSGSPDLNSINKIESILYSAGGASEFESLFVIASDGSKSSFLFQIQWRNQTIGNVTHKKGSYRLAAQLNMGNSTGLMYNHMVLDNSSTHSIRLIAIPKEIEKQSMPNPTPPNTNIHVDIGIANVSSNTFSANGNQTNVEKKTVRIPKFVIDSTLEMGNKYVLTHIDYINSQILFSFQIKEELMIKTDANKRALVILKTPSLANNNANMIMINGPQLTRSFQLRFLTGIQNNSPTPSEDTKAGLRVKYQLASTINNAANADPVINVFVSFDKNVNAYSYFSFTLTTWVFQSISVVANTLGDSFISELTPLFGNNSNTIVGYLGLNAKNQVFRFATDFSRAELLFDFANSVYKSLGNIYQIFTRPTNANWFVQLVDGTFAFFSNASLIGSWNQVLSDSSYELPFSFTLKKQEEISSNVLLRNVLDASQSNIDPIFTSFLNQTNTYLEFLSVNNSSLDPRLNGISPDVFIEILGNDNSNNMPQSPEKMALKKALEKGKESKTFELTLVFKQRLRKIESNGQISSTDSKTIEIGREKYTFFNQDGNVISSANNTLAATQNPTLEQKNFTVPSYLRNMFPSQVAALLQNALNDKDNPIGSEKNLIDHFLRFENILNPSITFVGNDLTGILSVSVLVPLLWSNETGLSQLTQNKVFNFNFGTEQNPMFLSNPFGNNNETIVELSDKYFADLSIQTGTNNQNLALANTSKQNQLNALAQKYSFLLPSQITKEQYFNDFLILGNAFRDQTNLNNESIILPTKEIDKNIKIIPNDNLGNALVEFTFPKIGLRNNVVVKFTTPKVFTTNLASKQNTFFSWRDESNLNLSSLNVANNTNTTLPFFGIDNGLSSISDIQASAIARNINLNNLPYQQTIAFLSTFANYSNFYSTLLANKQATLSATANDQVGSLTLSLWIDDNVALKNNTSNLFVKSFAGFKKNQRSTRALTQNEKVFSFGAQRVDENQKIYASLVNENYLIRTGVLSNEWKEIVNLYNAKLTITPSDATGIVKVDVDLTNYKSDNNFYPNITYTTYLTGFDVSSSNNNLLTWKTNAELGTHELASVVIGKISSNAGLSTASDYNYKLLSQIANLSPKLNAYLKQDPSKVLRVNIFANNAQGTLSVQVGINIENKVEHFNTVITGLGSTNRNASVLFNVIGEGNNNPELNRLRNNLPSAISINDADLLKIINFDSSDDFLKQIDLAADDSTGTLTITAKIIDPNDQQTLASQTRRFSGFVVQNLDDQGTNWTIVAISILVPLIVLSIPILLIRYYFDQKDIKKLASKLDKRLTDEYRRHKRLNRKRNY